MIRNPEQLKNALSARNKILTPGQLHAIDPTLFWYLEPVELYKNGKVKRGKVILTDPYKECIIRLISQRGVYNENYLIPALNPTTEPEPIPNFNGYTTPGKSYPASFDPSLHK